MRFIFLERGCVSLSVVKKMLVNLLLLYSYTMESDINFFLP